MLRGGDVPGCRIQGFEPLETRRGGTEVDLGLNEKVALVVASSKGLGRAVAFALAAEGARVVVSSRDREALSKTAAEIRRATGAEVHHQAADLTKPDDVKALVAAAVESFGGVDALVNNSGGPPAGDFEDFGDDGWQGAFELNLMSMVRCVREVLRSYLINVPRAV